jgi:hypothetical protein
MPFLTFTGEEYYPGGGWDDYKGVRSTIEAARMVAEEAEGSNDWYQIVDTASLKLVEQGIIEDTTTYDPYEEKRKAIPTDSNGIPIKDEGV